FAAVMALSADGTRVALAMNHAVAANVETVVKVWDVSDAGEVWHTTVNGAWRPWSLAIDEHGRMILLALVSLINPSRSKSEMGPNPLRGGGRAWSGRDGRETLNVTEEQAAFRSLALRPDGARLAAIRTDTGGASTIQILDTTNGRPVRNIELGDHSLSSSV